MKNCTKFICALSVLFATLVFTPVMANAATITVSPTSVNPGDVIKISVEGVNEESWIGIFKPNAKDSQYYDYEYVSELDATNTWEYTTSPDISEYEIRLFDSSDDRIPSNAAGFSVGLKEATFKISNVSVTPEAEVEVTIGNVPDTQQYSGTTVLLYAEGSKQDQYLDYEYIEELPIGNTWKLTMPREIGKYYFEVHQNDDYDKVMGKSETVEVVPFSPVIKLDKLSYKVNEPIKVSYDEKTVPKFDFELRIHKADAKNEDYVAFEYSSSLPANNIYTATITESGTYQVRLFYYDNTGDVLFGTSDNFTVTNEAFVSNYEGASNWAVTEIQDAEENNLTTPKVMIDFQKAVTREEFCEMVVKLYEKITGKVVEPASSNVFTDTNNPEILKANKLGIVEGMGDGTFAPNQSVNREQIAVMFYRCVKVAMPKIDTSVADKPTFYDKDEISDWALEAVEYFASKGIIQGSDGYFLPKAECTSEAAIALVIRTYNVFSKF